MLHAFLWGLSFLSDYRAANDALHSAFVLGLVNSGLLGAAGTWALIRSRVTTPRNRRGQPGAVIPFPGRKHLDS